MRFEKWEGLGNDFVLVEEEVDAERARAICDRRRGVGADGVISLVASAAELRMVVINADGSRPEMCGNGLRCAAGWLARRGGSDRGEVTIETDAGPRICRFERRGDALYDVRATMGRAIVGPPEAFEAGRRWRFVPVDVGNPHAVSFDDHVDADLDVVGPALERHQPGGVNVELCRRLDDGRLEVRVWERGVGRTLACGTGACAVAAAAIGEGAAAFDDPVVVVLPGGPLSITVSADFDLTMEGPARRVFVGELD
jgi:diaminopimelate epimerase